MLPIPLCTAAQPARVVTPHSRDRTAPPVRSDSANRRDTRCMTHRTGACGPRPVCAAVRPLGCRVGGDGGVFKPQLQAAEDQRGGAGNRESVGGVCGLHPVIQADDARQRRGRHTAMHPLADLQCAVSQHRGDAGSAARRRDGDLPAPHLLVGHESTLPPVRTDRNSKRRAGKCGRRMLAAARPSASRDLGS
jgi:hypothetical protein